MNEVKKFLEETRLDNTTGSYLKWVFFDMFSSLCLKVKSKMRRKS